MKPPRAIKVPLVSVVMANYRGARFLEESVRSVLDQSIENLELIVSDDGSDDASIEIIKKIALEDRRICLITGTGNTGPAATRNRALKTATGEWIAIVDSDDLMRRDRFELLIELGDANACDIVADDLTYFGDTEIQKEGTLLRAANRQVSQFVTADLLIETEIQGSGLPRLGYLKPLIRHSALKGMIYDETLRVGEDFDLLLRLLLRGANLFVTSESYYLYRRHSASISHRLSERKVSAMMAAQQALEGGDIPARTQRLLHLRRKALENLLAYQELVVRIKQRDLAGTAHSLIRRPALIKDLLQSVAENLTRRMRTAST